MIATANQFGPDAKKEFDSYAVGIIAGLKLGKVKVITKGASGKPGRGKGKGVLNPGPAVMAPLIQVAAVGSLPPIPYGSPTPLQILFFLALSQITIHALTALQVTTAPTDSVAVGSGKVVPGGFQIQAAVVEKLIIAEFAKNGLIPTPPRLGLAKAVGIAVRQIMLLTTMPSIPIVGGAPSSPGSTTVGVRQGVIS